MNPANDNSPRMISMKETCQTTAMSRSMIDALRTTGQFPLAVKLGEKKIAFVRSEVAAWLDSRIAARATT